MYNVYDGICRGVEASIPLLLKIAILVVSDFLTMKLFKQIHKRLHCAILKFISRVSV